MNWPTDTLAGVYLFLFAFGLIFSVVSLLLGTAHGHLHRDLRAELLLVQVGLERLKEAIVLRQPLPASIDAAFQAA